MGLSKKKIGMLLVAIALSSSTVVVFAAESTAANAEKPLFSELYSVSGNEPNFSIGSAETKSTSELFVRTMLTVLFVIAFYCAFG